MCISDCKDATSEIFGEIVYYSAYINRNNKYGHTPLLSVVRIRLFEVVGLLLSKGADMSTTAPFRLNLVPGKEASIFSLLAWKDEPFEDERDKALLFLPEMSSL
ncbi:hypothetical protein CC78DRAFT_575801 [Lojkania enalia]|uniref:Uncharacterized protein n=1 Tax=Lojkania enalia TaxID=147567 RepID=A0A9P4N3S1_9PLEO|nr:hypothetical protein CC78DRAFT_575801 [Didymosphaeria enalia]